MIAGFRERKRPNAASRVRRFDADGDVVKVLWSARDMTPRVRCNRRGGMTMDSERPLTEDGWCSSAVVNAETLSLSSV
jgi:hypothetical protein